LTPPMHALLCPFRSSHSCPIILHAQEAQSCLRSCLCYCSLLITFPPTIPNICPQFPAHLLSNSILLD
jgi:hypothetical protein